MPPNNNIDGLIEQLSKLPPLSSLTTDQQRQQAEQLFGAASCAEGVTFESASLASVSGLWAIPTDTRPDFVLLYLHGGGYSFGSARAYRPLISQLAARSRIRTLCIDYRLAPEHPFPAAIQDALGVYRALLEKGVSAEHLVLAGDSAGGGLCMALMLAAKAAGLPLPAAAVLMSPWVDMAQTGESWNLQKDRDPLLGPLAGKTLMSDTYLQGAEPLNPLASPLYGDLQSLPPVLIQVGSRECLLDDSTRLASRLATAEVAVHLDVWPGMIHVFQSMGDQLEEARRALDQISAFLLRHLGR
ncbi:MULTISPECIES: alpha/beta hydrolase [unclassified Pseudomonas]|uniref:alpha/beta hydrolase n=1 Tax=unclassified Pseudomonas TaxID=196821 RepID=UPI00215F9240|nr:alpha/beta hydrolase [Pseudomonas sp. B21-015]UVM52905.1 alpha/beta hydrolase [Pseudomonas sp. B21-015]